MKERYIDPPEAIPDAARAFLLQGGITETGAVLGKIHRFYHEEEAEFYGLDMAVFIINDWLEECQFLSSDTVLRTLGLPGRPRSGPGTRSEGCGSGDSRLPLIRKESFLIRVLYRENTSWQGEVRCRGRQAYFRSTMELMSLIRSALEVRVRKNTVRSATRAAV